MPIFTIKQVSQDLKTKLQDKIDQKTKPLGSLGKLEEVAVRIGLVQNTLSPVIKFPEIIVFAGDHGIVAEGVSAYPQEVTYQMVYNFLSGGAAINVLCRQSDINLKIVDAGVNYDFGQIEGLLSLKQRLGTRNFLYEPAMTQNEVLQAIQQGAEVIQNTHERQCNTVGFGEMGIGNTTAASAIMSVLCNLSPAFCTGRGAGISENGVLHKSEVIAKAISLHSVSQDPLTVLGTFGGYEIAGIVGGMLAAAEKGMNILIDGFIVTAAFLVAVKLYPEIYDYAIFCHKSNEKAHALLLDYLEVKPLFDLDMRLGEGTGAAAAIPMIKSAVCLLNEMASFDSASITSGS